MGSPSASAHAVAGQRLFPSTLSFDDPGIGAELPMTYSHIRDGNTTENEWELSVTKPLTPRFSLTAETGYLAASSRGGESAYGWDNLNLGVVWQAFVIPATESIGSLSLSRSFAHTGSKAVEDHFSTWSPEFDFGQGFGFLHAKWLRPLALTGSLAVGLPNDRGEPRLLDWGLSLQYNIAYLQDFVEYLGIKAPFNNLIPIIEFPMETCLDRGCSGQTTGTVNPGVIWIGHYFQTGVELQVPVNHQSGNSVGVLFGIDLYLDDLAPHSFGAPLFH
ncbi:MAG TPA: hypothetical protein VFQ88_02900 [Nevskiaceae bacterium]|nr:hypothetical protein [Nevskiaceae bacterium]